jgi:pyridoxal biosynthesis lyase PdxS
LFLYQQSGDPAKRARAIVQAVMQHFPAQRFLRSNETVVTDAGFCIIFFQVTHYNNPKILAEVSEDLGEAMVGLNMWVFRCVISVLNDHTYGMFHSEPNMQGGQLAKRGW